MKKINQLDDDVLSPRAQHLVRHLAVRDYCDCDYCGILERSCRSRLRQPRPDRYKAHRRGPVPKTGGHRG